MTKRGTGVHIEGANQLLRALNRMGKELSDTVRSGSEDVAERFLNQVAGGANTPAESKSAQAMRVYRDRYPKVGFPASRPAGVSGGATLGQIWFGTEFGSDSYPQFPSKTPGGRFFYPVLRSEGDTYAEAWFDVIADAVTAEWNRGARSAAVTP